MIHPGFGFGFRQNVRALVSASFATPSGGLFVLPPWLAIACASTGRTSQTSSSTIATGFGANAARARSVDGSTWGLSVESARRNFAPDTRIDHWTDGGVTVGSATDPAGASSSVLLTSNGAGGYRLLVVPMTAGAACVSLWEKILAPAPTGSGAIFTANFSVANVARTSVDAAWMRRSYNDTALTQSYNTVIQPRSASEAGTMLAYGYQVELGSYPSSVWLTTGTSTTRAADVLSIVSPSLIAPGGFFDMSLVIAPNYATAEQAADHDLLFFDSNNRVFIQQSTHKLVLRVGGVDVLSSALTWSRDQTLTVRAIHGRSGRALTISGATTGNGTATAAAVSAITLPGTVYVLGNASGAQECADLRSIAFRKAS